MSAQHPHPFTCVLQLPLTGLLGCLLLVLCGGLAPTHCQAQEGAKPTPRLVAPSAQNRLYDTTPELVNLNQQDNAIEITYALPFTGLVRFDLIDDRDEVVQQGQFVKERGEHDLRIDGRRLARGRYTYTLFYKGHTLRDTFRLQ